MSRVRLVDMDEIVIHYPTIIDLMDDLYLMGESRAAYAPAMPLSKDVLMAAEAAYHGTVISCNDACPRCRIE